MLSRKGYVIATLLLFFVIIGANFKAGYTLIGNDNFSPELAPSITLERSIFGPGWREYRALGVPSDSEQADIFRTLLYAGASVISIPAWIISQLYYFSTFFIAFYTAGKVVTYFVFKQLKKPEYEPYHYWIQFFGGLTYIGSLLALWIYFFPVHLFIAAFAFLPLVAWRLIEYAENHSGKNTILLIISSLFLSTAGLTATVFFMIYAALLCVGLTLFLESKKLRKGLIIGLSYILLLQLYWLIPFSLYVRSNTSALQDSLINRKITALQIQNEEKYNTFLNTPRYAFSWIDDKIDDANYALPDRDWYQTNPIGKSLTFVAPFFALVGTIALFKGKRKWGIFLIIQALVGIILIMGTNPPLGFLYGLLAKVSPVFAQVFRWRSSKFWPLLVLALPILTGIGLAYLQHAYSKASRSHKIPAIFIAACAALLLLMKPYITGNMIRSSMYNKVPSEYYALKDYLTQNDPTGRIYVVPEANTLYFRNYDWGFFGSVMMNYIVPNPTFEKALVIGSHESEAAANVIQNAYYSRNKDVFARALEQFDIKYILTDRHATRGVAGYPYDMSLVNDMTSNNSHLNKVWEKSGLSLYTVQPQSDDYVLEKINPAHDINKLSLYEILQQTNFSYVSQKDDTQQAAIYPFALNYDQSRVNRNENTVTLSTDLKLDGDYSTTLVQSDFLEAPAYVQSSDPNNLMIMPAFPRMSFNNSPLNIADPYVSFGKEPGYTIFSVNGRVITGTAEYLDTSYGQIIGNPNIKGWKLSRTDDLTHNSSPIKLFCNNNTKLDNLTVDKKLLCGTGKITTQSDTVIDIESHIKNSMNPLQASICVRSDQSADTCLNIQRNILIDGDSSLKLVIPRVISAEHTYEVFFEFNELNQQAQKHAQLSIQDFAIHTYDQSIDFHKVAEKEVPQRQSFAVHVNGGLTFSMELPLITSEASIIENGTEPSVLQSSYEPYSQKDSRLNLSLFQDAVIAQHKESAFSRYTDLQFNSRDSLAMILVRGKNDGGIPADIQLKNPKQGASVYENKLLQNKESMFYDFVVIPEGNPRMNIEMLSTALGPISSVNQLQTLIIQNIPQSWLQLKLVPSEAHNYQSLIKAKPALPGKESNIYIAHAKKDSILFLPTAVSPYWSIRKISNGEDATARLSSSRGSSFFSLVGAYADFFSAQSNGSSEHSAEAVIVNQWQQGFVIAEDGVYEVIFWPNMLIYLGYLLNISIIVGVLMTFVKLKRH